MTSELDALLARVDDDALRRDLKDRFERVSRRRSFGLVFEEHLPEYAVLPQHPIRRGVNVVFRHDQDAAHPRLVLRTAGNRATLANDEGDEEEAEVTDLVAVAEFGQPIYPGLLTLSSLDHGGDRSSHVVINGENYHVLEGLQFTHSGRIDCIYIDPPYNTGARDWKYNNNYVDSEDDYRNSKWLAFMKRRLLLAKRLLNPNASVLLVTIDEKEVHRLGLLLEQVFSGSSMQMITTVINPKGASLGNDFARVDEHIFVVYQGDMGVKPEVRDMLDEAKNSGADRSVKWSSLIRGGAKGIRTDSPGAYYPVFIDPVKGQIQSFGEALPWESDKSEVAAPSGTVAVWPPEHTSGVEGRWGIGPEKATELLKRGALRLGRIEVDNGKFPVSYLSEGIMEKVENGEIETVGRKAEGTLIVRYPPNTKTTIPKTVWRMKSHNAGEYGSKLITAMLPGRKFPFPKSLYAVEDILGFFCADKPNAIVLDFFAGSGTTAHAVMRLNHQDNGSRQSISVTNNEVSESESRSLREAGYLPGDQEWEALGIFEHIARPRITAAVTGLTPESEPVVGDYKFVDPFPIADGFEENVEFMELTYLDPDDVELDQAFTAIAPLLWLRSGAIGPMIKNANGHNGKPLPFASTDRYGVLFSTDSWRPFINGLPPTVRTVFIVTDSTTEFAGIVSELPSGTESVRLYESYLRTFVINVADSTL